MGYNRENFAAVKAEYSNKYLKAQRQADERKYELYVKLPEVRAIDGRLSSTCARIMEVIGQGRESVEKRLEEIKEQNKVLYEKRARLLTDAGFPADYSDVKYECDICGDTGYVDTVMCDCMKKALTLAGYKSSGLGGLIERQSFENFSFDYYPQGTARETMMRNHSMLKDFAESFSAGTYANFLLVGGTGLGKTHMSTSVAKLVIERGYDVLYVTAVGMISDFEEKRFGNSLSGTQRRDTSDYYEADLLIIDDLGTEIINQFSASCIYDLINTRLNNKKCTMINTNLTAKELEARYTERIASRLFGEYSPLVFVGNDVRRQKLGKK